MVSRLEKVCFLGIGSLGVGGIAGSGLGLCPGLGAPPPERPEAPKRSGVPG